MHNIKFRKDSITSHEYSDHNPQFIGSQQTHRKRRLHQIELQEHRAEHGIEDQIERRSHLATRYGPVGLWLTTHASLEGNKDDVEVLLDQFPFQ